MYTISEISFKLLHDKDIYALSHVELQSTSISKSKTNTLYDNRMGCSMDQSICVICLNTYEYCSGHIGHIKLENPILHPCFSSNTTFKLKDKQHTKVELHDTYKNILNMTYVPTNTFTCCNPID